MGLILKKDEDRDDEYIDGIEVIARGEGPNGDEEDVAVEVHEGLTAEDISGKTAAREAERELEADPELLDVEESDVAESDMDEPSAIEPDTAGDVDSPDVEGADEGEGGDSPDGDESDEAEAGTPSDTEDGGGASGKLAALDGRHKMYLGIALAAVIIAAILGYVIGSGGIGSKGLDSSTLTEGQLDTTIATWSYNGANSKITAREAIESQYSLDSVKDADGNYPTPSADAVLSYARSQVLLKEAEKQGISIDGEELSAAAEDALGTSDFAVIAEQYQVTEDQAKEIVREQATIQKLYQTVVKTTSTAPEAPAEPENGDEATASKDYATYIIDLAGDEWDAEAGTWASTDGTIASALTGEEFTADSATYAQAQKAYMAAYQEYAVAASTASEDWTKYVNDLFAKANITLYGLFA